MIRLREVCSLGGISVDLVRVVMLSSKHSTLLDTALGAWDGMELWTDFGSWESGVRIEFCGLGLRPSPHPNDAS